MDFSYDYTLSMLNNPMLEYGINNNNTEKYSYTFHDNMNLANMTASFPAPALTEYSGSLEYMLDANNDFSANVTPDLIQLPQFPQFHFRPRGFSCDSGVSFQPSFNSNIIKTKTLSSNVQLDLTPVENRRHSVATTKNFTCPHCTKSFDRKFVLKRHMGSHRHIRPFTCQPCSMSFYRKDIFDRHVATKKCVKAHIAQSTPTPPHNED